MLPVDFAVGRGGFGSVRVTIPSSGWVSRDRRSAARDRRPRDPAAPLRQSVRPRVCWLSVAAYGRSAWLAGRRWARSRLTLFWDTDDNGTSIEVHHAATGETIRFSVEPTEHSTPSTTRSPTWRT